MGCMGVVASFHLRDDLLAVLSHLEPSESGQVARVPRLALGLEVFLVGFGPVLLGSFTETWSGTAPRNQWAPLAKPSPMDAGGTQKGGRDCVVNLCLCLDQACIETTFLSKRHRLPTDPFPVSVKFRGTSSYIRT